MWAYPGKSKKWRRRRNKKVNREFQRVTEGMRIRCGVTVKEWHSLVRVMELKV